MSGHLSEQIERAVSALKAAGATEVYLFGSAAKTAMRVDSDIDLAACGLPPEKFFTAMGDAADLLDRSLDLIDLDEDTPFTRYLKEQGELLRVG